MDRTVSRVYVRKGTRGNSVKLSWIHAAQIHAKTTLSVVTETSEYQHKFLFGSTYKFEDKIF